MSEDICHHSVSSSWRASFTRFVFFSAGMDVCELAATYATDNKRRALERISEKECKVRSFDYDWSLNDAAKR